MDKSIRKTTNETNRRLLLAGGCLVACLAVLLGTTQAAHGAVFNCTAGDGNCLTAAIVAANGNGEANTINLQAGNYTFAVINNVTDGNNGLPSITGSLIINGDPHATTIIERATGDGVPEFRMFHVAATGTLTLNRLKVMNGIAGDGGAIFNRGTLVIRNSTIANNSAVGYSGLPGDGYGGGILNAGSLTVIDSTVSSNRGWNVGGGIYNDTNSTALIASSTIGNNSIQGGGGGGIGNAGSLILISCTISGNVASGNHGGGDGGGLLHTSGVLQMVNTILAGNFSYNMRNELSPDCAGSPISLGHNVVGDPSHCGIILLASDYIGNPKLGIFHDNGDPGAGFFPLLASSPAVNAGDNAVCTLTDQLGQLRTSLDRHARTKTWGHVTKKIRCDIGAVEF